MKDSKIQEEVMSITAPDTQRDARKHDPITQGYPRFRFKTSSLCSGRTTAKSPIPGTVMFWFEQCKHA